MIKVFKKGLCKSKLKRKRKGTVLLLFICSGNMLGISKTPSGRSRLCVRHTLYWVRQSYTGPEKNHRTQVASNNKDAKNQAEGEGSSEWMWGTGEVKDLQRTRNWRHQI